MGFNAGKAVVALDYDFTAFIEGAKGTIPEPTQDELEAFYAGMAEIAEIDVPEDGDVDAEAARTAISEVLSDDGLMRQFWPKVLDALEPICKGSPTRAQIEALPARIRLAFFDWLTSELTDPTKQNAASRR